MSTIADISSGPGWRIFKETMDDTIHLELGRHCDSTEKAAFVVEYVAQPSKLDVILPAEVIRAIQNLEFDEVL